ncbi:hypothetical protein [Jiulongibacter sediminis]|jgi:hypothetical protein|uniref:hypothetical protein n=1 Tax=Jiulongibacter sediminis TaxID=1605367 RepID=UPI0026EB8221|nr:hypothetical protein [Jiulongibacter sediminis]
MGATLKSKWVKGYAIFLAIFTYGAGITAYTAPQAMFSMLDVDWDAVKMLSNGFAARNISVGIFALLTIWSKNAHVYLVLFATRLSIDLQDMINGITVGADVISPLATISSLGLAFILPLTLGIRTILKEVNKSS